jgi:uncharacterized protein (TIGR00369 family)
MDPTALRQVMEELIPFNKVLGVRVVEIDRGHVRFEVPFREELIGDPLRRALHGGVISALADTAGGCCVWSAADDPRARVSTIDMRIDYLRPGRSETIVAEATLVRAGRRVGVTDMRLFHPSAPGDAIATGKGVYNIVVPKGG